MKTVAEMTEREQIERLLRQRNELWALIDRLILKHASVDDARSDFLKNDDLPSAHCCVEDGEIVVNVSNTLENLSSVRFDINNLIEASEEIVDKTYIVEGKNHQTGERDPDAKDAIFDLYANAPSGWWNP